MAAAAAALLVAVAFGWWIGRDGKQDNREPSLARNAPRRNRPQPRRAGAGEQPANEASRRPRTAKTSTWDDPLETQIASVSQQISNVEQNWQHRVDDVDLVQYRIDEVADSLQNDTL